MRRVESLAVVLLIACGSSATHSDNETGVLTVIAHNGHSKSPATSGGDITLTPATPTETFPATFTNVPPMVSRILLQYSPGLPSYAVTMTPSPTTNLDVTGWHGFGSRFVATVDRSDGASQRIVAGAQDAVDLTLDLGSALLPWMQDGIVDPVARTFQAPALPGGNEGDLFAGVFTFLANNRLVKWTLFAAAPSTFAWPTIPSNVVNTVPDVMLTPYTGDGFMADGDTIDGYAEARLAPLELWRPRGARTTLSACPGCNLTP